MRKRLFLALTALFVMTLSYAQEYMVFENNYGGIARFDVSIIKQAYFKTYEPYGSGSATDSYNVAGANTKCKDIGPEFSAQQYYVKGLVTSISRNASGTAIFYIADDITGINRLYVYDIRVPLQNELKRGDEVVIYCSLRNANNVSPEATGQLVAINGQNIETPEPHGSGTEADPFNIAGVIEYVKGLGTDVVSPKDVYFKGYITSITEAYGTQYGNATFEVSDTEDGGNRFLCYRVKYFDGQSYSNPSDPNIKDKDLVVMCGKVVNYKGTTPETSANAAWLYSLNGKKGGGTPSGGDAKGTGTEADPFNIAGVIEYVSGLGVDVVSPKEVYFKGYITSITEAYGTQYGNATFEVSDTEDGGNKFLCYRVKYFNNQGYSNPSDPNIKDKDLVVMCGKVINYKGTTPETSANAAWLYSLNGTTLAATLGTLDTPLTVADALEYISKLEDNGTTKEDAYVAGKITKILSTAENIAKYKNIDYVISDGTNELTVFRGRNIANNDFTEAGQINEGDEVVVFGKLTKYVKDGIVTPEVAQDNYIVSLTKGSGGEGADGSIIVTVADFNAAAESTDVWYQLTGTVKNLKDNDQYGNFDLEDSTGSVYVYGLLSEKGGAKKKFQELVAAEGIKNGSMITIVGNRGSYNGKIEVRNAYFIKVENVQE